MPTLFYIALASSLRHLLTSIVTSWRCRESILCIPHTTSATPAIRPHHALPPAFARHQGGHCHPAPSAVKASRFRPKVKAEDAPLLAPEEVPPTVRRAARDSAGLLPIPHALKAGEHGKAACCVLVRVMVEEEGGGSKWCCAVCHVASLPLVLLRAGGALTLPHPFAALHRMPYVRNTVPSRLCGLATDKQLAPWCGEPVRRGSVGPLVGSAICATHRCLMDIHMQQCNLCFPPLCLLHLCTLRRR